jgi:hypothetical protein
MKDLRKFIATTIKEFLNENYLIFNPHKYNSFSELTEQDLYEIGRWGLKNDFSTSGAWDDADTLEEATKNIVDGFKLLLKDKFPDGFNGIPKKVMLYRMVVLENPQNLDKNNLGYSWFTNPNRIKDPYFRQQLLHLKAQNVYLIVGETHENNIDIPRSLFQRDMVWVENEIVVKNDKNVKFVELRKI